MTRQHFKRAAEIVRAIKQGCWSPAAPWWYSLPYGHIETSTNLGNISPDFVRAMWTAEAFEHLFSEFNPRFDRDRFRIACVLEAPAKKGNVKA